jgi:adenosine deaminase
VVKAARISLFALSFLLAGIFCSIYYLHSSGIFALCKTPQQISKQLQIHYSSKLCSVISKHNGVLATQKVQNYLDSIKKNRAKLLLFLEKLPKGADLHSHLGGISTPEDLLKYSEYSDVCIDLKTMTSYIDKNCACENKVTNIIQNPKKYEAVIQAWSLKNWETNGTKQTQNQHFFNAFKKFKQVFSKFEYKALAYALHNSTKQNEIYAELMRSTNIMSLRSLSQKILWHSNDLKTNYKNFFENNIELLVQEEINTLDNIEKSAKQELHCSTSQEKAGCHTKVRYITSAYREEEPSIVFANLIIGFELATKDQRFVGINLVQNESGYIAIRDYNLHMQMLEFLHQKYPLVSIALHAGELSAENVRDINQKIHIQKAIEVGKAQRIGHGTSIIYEKNSQKLLPKMAKDKICVEINLTSNEKLLNIHSSEHPLLIYMKHKVPIVISTDDKGVLGTNLTEEYYKAVVEHSLQYTDLKEIARNSIAYSFLPGDNLWQDRITTNSVSPCKKDILGTDAPSQQCRIFLESSEKAKMQWQLEKQLIEFEKKF